MCPPWTHTVDTHRGGGGGREDTAGERVDANNRGSQWCLRPGPGRRRQGEASSLAKKRWGVLCTLRRGGKTTPRTGGCGRVLLTTHQDVSGRRENSESRDKTQGNEGPREREGGGEKRAHTPLKNAHATGRPQRADQTARGSHGRGVAEATEADFEGLRAKACTSEGGDNGM